VSAFEMNNLAEVCVCWRGKTRK